jgi:hypothetical protein
VDFRAVAWIRRWACGRVGVSACGRVGVGEVSSISRKHHHVRCRRSERRSSVQRRHVHTPTRPTWNPRYGRKSTQLTLLKSVKSVPSVVKKFFSLSQRFRSDLPGQDNRLLKMGQAIRFAE